MALTIIRNSGIVRDGILYEKLSTQGWDVGMFKGICARYFGILARALRKLKVHSEVAELLENTLQTSARAIMASSQKDKLYPLEWQKPPRAELYNFNTHVSALIALLAAAPSVEP